MKYVLIYDGDMPYDDGPVVVDEYDNLYHAINDAFRYGAEPQEAPFRDELRKKHDQIMADLENGDDGYVLPYYWIRKID